MYMIGSEIRDSFNMFVLIGRGWRRKYAMPIRILMDTKYFALKMKNVVMGFSVA